MCSSTIKNKILCSVLLLGCIPLLAIKISSGPPPNYGTMSVDIPNIWDSNENLTESFQNDRSLTGLGVLDPNGMRGANPEDIRNIVVNEYFQTEKYYFEYGVSGTNYCNDWDHLDGLTTSGFDVEVDLNQVQSIWFQVVSQCHSITMMGANANVGFWWKGETQYVDAQNPSQAFNNIFYMYMTTNCTSNGQDYGCGVEDLQ